MPIPSDGCALVPEGAPVVLGTELDPAEVPQLDQLPVGTRHGQVGELLRRLELAQRAHRELPPVGLDPAGRNLDVPAPDSLLDVLHGESARRQLRGRQPDPHRETPLTDR